MAEIGPRRGRWGCPRGFGSAGKQGVRVTPLPRLWMLLVRIAIIFCLSKVHPHNQIKNVTFFFDFFIIGLPMGDNF